jgi:hypothetical protein
VSLDPSIPFDILTITIDPADVRGVFEGEHRTALAEVQVIGKAHGGAPPTIVFIAGDANCDSLVDMSDAITLLDSLFRGAGPLCCEASADVTGEGWIDVADAVRILSHLFRSGDAFSRQCERATGSRHTCEQETCP